MGGELLDAIVSWKAFVVSLVVLGLVPGVALRLIVRTYPRDNPADGSCSPNSMQCLASNGPTG
jgi:hypothetical protein